MIKEILVHLGPHKTGSTTIQKTLNSAISELASANCTFLHNKETHNTATSLANEEFEKAEILLGELSKKISNLSERTVILSQEDFSGELIGRTGRRAVYPKLTKNMRIIERALKPHSVKFVFFVRDEDSWIRSCYNQHLKHRTRFSTFDDFKAHYGVGLSWSELLSRPKETFGNRLFILEYEQSKKAGVMALLSRVVPDLDIETVLPLIVSSNVSPSINKIKDLEYINAVSDFADTAFFAKSLVLHDWKPGKTSVSKIDFQPWPRKLEKSKLSPFVALENRAKARVAKQSVADLLPPETVNLAALSFEKLPVDVALPDLPRSDMHNQTEILNYHLRGRTKLCHLNALTISYLRRDTAYTSKARTLFHRIWAEKGVILVNELSTRWLISTLQTFLDHGENENQRLIGASSYFYANLMKIYEGERAIEGLEQDASYDSSKPQTPNRFRGMDRYDVGGTDLLLNTNALAIEIANGDDIAGLVFKELLLRVKNSGNVFTRNDKTRKKMDINVRGFEDTWVFFEPR